MPSRIEGHGGGVVKEGWHCGDCEEELLMEVSEHGGCTIHCCFHCGSPKKLIVFMGQIIEGKDTK